jgi:hypothetical protein
VTTSPSLHTGHAPKIGNIVFPSLWHPINKIYLIINIIKVKLKNVKISIKSKKWRFGGWGVSEQVVTKGQVPKAEHLSPLPQQYHRDVVL